MKRGLLLTALLALACDFGGDVDHRGRYGFLPGQGPVSTAPLPLHRLLVIESDASVERTRFYFFEGELGEAGIGLDDLRKLALGFNRFDLSFAPPIENAAPSGDGGAGGDPGEPSVPIETLALQLDEGSVELSSLTAAELAATGAGRFASVLDGAGFHVRAFFGAHPGANRFERVSVGTLDYRRQLSPLELDTELGDAAISVVYGAPKGLDYLELAFLQPLMRTEDRQALDAGVITTMWSGSVYRPSFELLTNVFAQACWSLDAPLRLRATQYAQSYFTPPGGHFAVLERRTDELTLEPAEWNRAVGEAGAVEYCGGLESSGP